MVTILIFLAEMLFLFYLSRQLTKALSRILPMHLLAILFFPGTLLHELAHLLTAGVLFVPVGAMDLVPEMHTETSVRLGSVQIGKTDPFRRILIGVAPILWGLAAMATTFYFAKEAILSFTPGWVVLAVVFLIFEVSNTMYSSRKDVEGAAAFLVALLIVGGSLFLVVNPTHLFARFDFSQILEVWNMANILLTIPIGIDLAVIGLINVILRR